MAAPRYAQTKITLGGTEYDAEIFGPADKGWGAFEFKRIGSTVTEVFERLRHGTWGQDDVKLTIRAGLYGGGYGLVEIDQIVRTKIDAHPLANAAPEALRILGAYLYGLVAEE